MKTQTLFDFEACDRTAERWLPIPGTDGWYDVSDRGRVRSWRLWRTPGGQRPGERAKEPRIMEGWTNNNGYPMVGLFLDGVLTHCQVHCLVLEAFVGPRPEGLIARHLDGDESNPALYDEKGEHRLAWGDWFENAADRYRHGTSIPAVPIEEPEPFLFTDPFIPWEAIVPWEVWKTIPGWPDYDVSNRGRIMSRKWGKIRIRKLITHKQGHKWMSLSTSVDGQWTVKRVFVHLLMMNAFSPRPSPGLICRHVDGIPDHNDQSNLRWGTHRENSRDKIHHGTILRGEDNPISKLTEDQVREIRRRRAAGEGRGPLASEFGVNRKTIVNIETRRQWRHVE